MEDLIQEAVRRSARYLKGLEQRSVAPPPEAVKRLGGFDAPLQDEPTAPMRVLADLDDIGSAATVASAGPRYFGFVTGGTLPAALAASYLAGAWDQNAAFHVASPTTAFLEEICRRWLVALFGLPPGAGIGFVTGATMANFSALAAARHALLGRLGWDVEARGLFGAPPITVIVGAEVHVSVLKALSLLGLGRERVIRVATDGQGRMRPEAVPPLTEPAIICIQAGNVNTGAFDPAADICELAKASDSWVHVDGAFGLWAAACPDRRFLAAGIPEAHSWATDAHKWLNVPYDSGIVLVADPRHLQASMSASAAYFIAGDAREPSHYTPELSRRARGVEIWAALRSLGRLGLADLIERNCRYARRFAEGLKLAGYDVLNEVVLNQVLVSFGTPDRTRQVVRRVQEDGTCWCGGTEWQGHAAMRISVSSWATTGEDVERSLRAMIRLASDR
ncbi:MAG: aspartate aminotransferase family protein [Deltaproteobacteria bacterium]|nr:aspartate aminotransferase family protein [Deltaproteobacteria bacterium]